MRESGEHMEFGIFDFYKVLSKAFGGGEDRVESGRCRHRPRDESTEVSVWVHEIHRVHSFFDLNRFERVQKV